MTEQYFASLLIVGGVCLGFALHALSLAARTRDPRYGYLLALALLEGVYCIVAWRYLSLTDSAAARPWGQTICAFTPIITYIFGELTMDLAQRRERWLVRLQRLNLLLTGLFTTGVVIDLLYGTSLMLRPTLETDLGSIHRHRVIFMPMGQAYLTWVSLAFMIFAGTLFFAYPSRRYLLPMVVGCAGYFVATILDFGILVGTRDAIFVQHFGFLALVVGCWRVLSNRFEDTLNEMRAAVVKLEEQRRRLLVAAPMLHKQKLTSIGTLAAGVAHEINNPIQGIMNYALLLKRELGANEVATSFADEITAESQRVADIVRSLLHFGRADASVAVATNVRDLVNETLSLVRSTFDHDRIEVELAFEEGIPEIDCRPAQLRQVLMNLLTNARDAINARGPERIDPRRVVIRGARTLRGEDAWVTIEVEDSGCGVDPVHVTRVFDPFFSTKGAEGMGLGLSVSHGIVHNHGGELTCDSRPGKGATFTIRIPYVHGERTPSSSSNPPLVAADVRVPASDG